jgi:hypothetical protein
MRRKLVALAIATVALSGFGVSTASAATSTCHSTSHKVTSGDTTTTDSTRTCSLVRGGSSRNVTHKVSTKTSAGTVSTSRSVTNTRSVSKKGVVTITVSVRTCTKDAGAKQVCDTVTDSK